MEIYGILYHAICTLIVTSCIYTSLALITSAIEHLREFWAKLRQSEQKPWTEEDEKQARQIERIVHNDGCTQKLQKQIADWFESLKGRVGRLEVKEVDLDVQDIYGILYLERIVMRDFGDKEYSHEELCQEVLKRFKAQKV